MDLTISTALELQDFNKNLIITIKEKNFVDASFLIGYLLEQRIAKQDRIILVLHHQCFGHYQGVGTKLGMNLQALKDSGRLYVVDVMNEIRNESMKSDKSAKWLEDILEKAYWETQGYVSNHPAENFTIVLEHSANPRLAYHDLPLSIILHYIKLFQGLSTERVRLICLTKTLGDDATLEIVSALMQHQSDLMVTVRGLQTGSATDISGAFELTRKDSLVDGANRQSEFHYFLQDKKALVFAPGTVQFR